MELGFWRIAMRPGKPLMHGRLGPMRVLGLPGNPTSSMVCSILFLRPLLRALHGKPDPGADPSQTARLAVDLPANGVRQDYMRASLSPGADGILVATPAVGADSSLVKTMARADGLIVRPPHAEPRRLERHAASSVPWARGVERPAIGPSLNRQHHRFGALNSLNPLRPSLGSRVTPTPSS